MNRILLFVILSILLPVSQALQDLLPPIPPFQERLQLLPIVFAFGVLALPLLPALWFALLTALVQGLVLLQVQDGQVEIGLTLPVVFFLGWAFLLQMTSESTQGMRWELHAFGSALVTVSMIAGQFLTLCIKRGGFPVDWSVLMRIVVPSAAALLIAPLLYFALRFLVPIAPDDSGDRKTAGFGV
jgi:hypothetical protein